MILGTKPDVKIEYECDYCGNVAMLHSVTHINAKYRGRDVTITVHTACNTPSNMEVVSKKVEKFLEK